MAFLQSLGNLTDKVGTALGLPEFDLSESIAGNKTTNTGRKALAGTGGQLPPAEFIEDIRNKRNAGIYGPLSPYDSQYPVTARMTNGTLPQAKDIPTDPVTDTEQTGANGTGLSVGGSSAPALPDRSREIAAQNSRLAQLDPSVQAQLGQLQSDYDKIISGYNTDRSKNAKLFGDMQNTNRSNLDRGLQSIYMNSANQLQGLNSILASLGALSGTNIGQVGRLVQNASNQDIGDVNSVFRSNQGALQGEYDRFQDEDQRRREELSGQLSNQQKSVNMEALTQRQNIFNSLSNLYAEMGDSVRANEFAAQARALDSQIVPLTVRSQALAPVAASFTPQALSNYMRGGTTTSIQQRGQTPQGVANLVALRGQDEEEREQA